MLNPFTLRFMTKYLLNSGKASTSADKGKKFYNQIVEGLGSKPEILFCLFAQPRENWEQRFNKLTTDFAAVLDTKIQPTYKLALPKEFTEQIESAQVIYIPGGDDRLLQYWLKQYDLPLLWYGKTIATSSAGSDALVKHYWTCDWRECQDGLGIVPIKFIPHFNSTYGNEDPRGPIDWQEAHKELETYGDTNLPIYALPEGEYKIFEI